MGLAAGKVGDKAEAADLSELRTAVDAGRVSALYVFDPGPDGSIGDTQWIVDARKRGTLPLLIVQGVLATDLARAADFVLPGASYVEKEASYTNDQGRLQGASRVIAPPGEAMEDWQILVNVGVALGVAFDYTSAAECARRHRAAVRRSAGARRHRDARLRTADGSPALASGVQSFRALEVGFHVPGSAAGEGRRRSVRGAAAARRDSVATDRDSLAERCTCGFDAPV